MNKRVKTTLVFVMVGVLLYMIAKSRQATEEDLPPERISELTRKAENGDSNAAYNLEIYYKKHGPKKTAEYFENLHSKLLDAHVETEPSLPGAK